MRKSIGVEHRNNIQGTGPSGAEGLQNGSLGDKPGRTVPGLYFGRACVMGLGEFGCSLTRFRSEDCGDSVGTANAQNWRTRGTVCWDEDACSVGRGKTKTPLTTFSECRLMEGIRQSHPVLRSVPESGGPGPRLGGALCHVFLPPSVLKLVQDKQARSGLPPSWRRCFRRHPVGCREQLRRPPSASLLRTLMCHNSRLLWGPVSLKRVVCSARPAR